MKSNCSGPGEKRWRFYITFVAGGNVAIYFLVTALLKDATGTAVSHVSAWQYFLTEVALSN